ncbi:hypothetical protein Q671_00265 [Halomonas sp. PBN3]|nr:hypothetical protein Q671_00265 [Halomonas sp. PBN3]
MATPMRCITSPPSPGMRIFSPSRSSTEVISLLYQPPICTPEAPAVSTSTPNGS